MNTTSRNSNSLPLYQEIILDEKAVCKLDREGESVLVALASPQYQRRGTIVPWHWKRELVQTFGNCKGRAMAEVLAYVAERWTPTVDEMMTGGRALRKRFRYNLPQLSYWHLEQVTGYSQSQLKRALQALEVAGKDGKPLVKRFFQDVRSHESGEVVSKMFLMIYPDNIEESLGWLTAPEPLPDSPKYDVVVDADGKKIELGEIQESIEDDDDGGDDDCPHADCPLDFVEPVTTAEVDQVVVSSGDRVMTSAEMDEIVLMQQNSDPAVAVKVRELTMQNIYPEWRTSWTGEGLDPEFLAYLKAEFEKVEWGARTTPKLWLRSRERAMGGNWVQIALWHERFKEFKAIRLKNQQRRPQPVAPTCAAQPPQEQDDFAEIRKLAIKLNLPFTPDDLAEKIDAAVQALIGKGLDLSLILDKYPKLTPYVTTTVA